MKDTIFTMGLEQLIEMLEQRPNGEHLEGNFTLKGKTYHMELWHKDDWEKIKQ